MDLLGMSLANDEERCIRARIACVDYDTGGAWSDEADQLYPRVMIILRMSR